MDTLWIARNGDGGLYLFGQKPCLHPIEQNWGVVCRHCGHMENGFCELGSICIHSLPKDMYPELQPCECKELKNSVIMDAKEMLSHITQFLQKKLYLPKGSLVYKCITIKTGLTEGNLTIENGKAMIEKCDEPEELTDPEDIGRVFIFLRENFPDFGTMIFE